MSTFSPWFSGTPSYSTYAGDIGGASLLSRNRPSVKQVQQSAPVAMPRNVTNVSSSAPQPQQQPQKKNNSLDNIKAMAEMAKKFMGPGDVTGTGPSTPGYSIGMDLSGEAAIEAADAGLIPQAEAAIPAVHEGVVASGTETMTAGAGSMIPSGTFPVIGAGLVGGKLGGFFGNAVGEQLGVGGKKEREVVGGTLGGAATGAATGAMFGGIGALPGALIGGLAGGVGKLFSL